jgi:mycofactocin system glycosyltransferase
MVVAGSPLRLFRLTEGGAHVVAQLEAGSPSSTAAVRQLVDRLVEAGAVHPLPSADESPFGPDDVTVVMPAFGHVPDLPQGLATIVVDDASPVPLAPPDSSDPVIGGSPRTWLRHDTNRGPGAARNTGLAAVTTPLVAFVDADVLLPLDWLAPLLAHFADPRVALVAPRVASMRRSGRVALYDVGHSPLDLGEEPARVRPGTRVSYVPAAVVVCRTDVVRGLGGFDESLRTGEDVDFVWRLVAAGHRARYEPHVVVHHEPRGTWRDLWRQRVGYGRSAAPLAARHPGALAPARFSGWTLAVWTLLVLRRPVVAGATAVGTAVALQRKLTDLPPAESARLALLGHAAAGRQLASAVRRVWWPLALVASLTSRRMRRWVALAVVAPPVIEAVSRRSWRPIVDAPAALADDVAYGVGVWAGMFAERSMAALVPSISGWPARTGD